MGIPPRILCAVIGALALATHIAAAELPSQVKKSKPAEAVKHCNIVGSPGVVAANGICVRMSGYVSAGFGAGQIK
jgi:hypothetical protein